MANQLIDPTKTRKDAQIFTVTDPADAIGYYLAEDLTKTWQEDFADGDTGEVVTINRREIIKRRGELVTADLASSLIFYIQTGDVTEIKVSDQRRQALEYNNTRLKPYKVTAIINSKRHQFILEAQTVELAMEVARDWIELNYNGDFTIIGVAALQNVVLLNSTLERTNDETGESEEISGSGEADGETTRYYKAEAEVKITYFGEDTPRDVNFTFIVKTLGVIRDLVYCGNEVTLRGFGTFQIKQRKAKAARNISAGTTIQIPARKVVVFKPYFNTIQD